MNKALSSRIRTTVAASAALLASVLCATPARADSPLQPAALTGAALSGNSTAAYAAAAAATRTSRALTPAFDNGIFDDVYALGVAKYRVDGATKVTGWRLNDGWYLGSQSGEDSGLTLVWQTGADQMSLSKDGIRFTRRF